VATAAGEAGNIAWRIDPQQQRPHVMLYWAAVFLLIGPVAMLLGAGTVAGVSDIAWILFAVGIVLAIILFLLGRRLTL
jgi:uncharacterized membrane protein YtjA (UPF0391 family)